MELESWVGCAKALNLLAKRKGFEAWIDSTLSQVYFAKCNICDYKFSNDDLMKQFMTNTPNVGELKDATMRTLQAHGLMHLKEYSLLVFI